MSRFNFFNITLEDQADISKVMENFDKIEATSAIVDDLPKTKSVTFKAANWIAINDGALYQYTLEDEIIKAEPYNIDVIFNDLNTLVDAIYPKANSQSAGSIILVTPTKPTVDLLARLIVTKGVEQNVSE